MERRNENESISSTQKRIERQRLKLNETNQDCDNIIPYTFGLEEIIKHEIINMNIDELRNGISNRKLTKLFLFQSNIDVDGKLVETIMPLKDIESFKIFLDVIDEHYDEESTIIKEADMFIETNRKLFDKVKRNEYGKATNNIGKKVVRYEGKNCFIPPGGINCFFFRYRLFFV